MTAWTRPTTREQPRLRSLTRGLLLSAFLVVVMSALVHSTATAATLTIDEATHLALKNNEGYLMARAELDKAEADVKNAVAGALPHIDLTGRYTRNIEIPEVVFAGETFRLGTKNNFNVGLSLNQPIWLGGKVFSAVKIARLYRRYISERVSESEAALVYTVRQVFLAAILAQDAVSVYRDAVEAATLNLEMVNKMRDQGVVAEYELLRAEVELANLKPQLIQAENQVTIAKQYLANTIGIEMAGDIELAYEFSAGLLAAELSLDYLQGYAAENRASLRERDYYESMREKAIGVAKSGSRPQISLSSQLDWTRQTDVFGISFSNWSRSISASLNITMPLFDGFATSAEVQKAKLDYASSQLETEQAASQVELEVREAYLSYVETSDRLAAQEKTVDQAEEGLRIARLRYQQGVGTQLEVLAAESALTRSKTNYVQATHDAALAVYRLLRVTGADNFGELREQ